MESKDYAIIQKVIGLTIEECTLSCTMSLTEMLTKYKLQYSPQLIIVFYHEDKFFQLERHSLKRFVDEVQQYTLLDILLQEIEKGNRLTFIPTSIIIVGSDRSLLDCPYQWLIQSDLDQPDCQTISELIKNQVKTLS